MSFSSKTALRLNNVYLFCCDPSSTNSYPLYQATHLIQGDVSFRDTGEAQHLLAGATSFFRGIKHQYDGDYEEELQSADAGFQNEWGNEQRSVFMLSGCKDEQTSADAFINGRHVGMPQPPRKGKFGGAHKICRSHVVGVSGDDEEGCLLECLVYSGEILSRAPCPLCPLH